jgi:hypothetical protein
MTDTSVAAAPRAGRREWIGLAVIALPCVLYSMDLTVLNLAVPALTADLKPSSAQLLWIVDIYGFLVAGSLITMGVPADAAEAARGTLGGAVAVAEQLPDHVGAALLGTARDAFVEALRLSAAISAAITIALAIAVVVVLRRARPGSASNGQANVVSNKAVAA